MTDIKRYDCTNGRAQHCYGCYQMTESEYGDYVEFEDHSRIVAAKDAEIARLDAGWHEANKKVLEVSLAQPARQVGGDEREWSNNQVHDFLTVALRHVEVEGSINFQDIRDAMRYMREKYGAALAPAAVVMPERSDERGSDGDLTYEAKSWNACLDRFIELNGGHE